jgi:hypothetical protein
MDLGEIECEGVDWIQMAQIMDQLRDTVNVAMDLRVPYKGGFS